MTTQQLQNKARFVLGNLDTDNYSDAELLLALNDYYYQAVAIALRSSGAFEINGEIATTDIVANQQEYVLPTSLIAVEKIEANFLGGTKDWVNLNLVDERTKRVISNDDAQDATTAIQNCTLYDNSIFLQYKPESNQTAGLKIWYSKEATALSDAGDEPNLPEHLHLYLVYGACADYSLRTENDSDYNKFMQLLLKKEDEIRTHYSNRSIIDRPRIITRRENFE